MRAKVEERAMEGGHSCPPNGGLENPPSAAEWTFVLVADSLSGHSIGRENQIPSAEIKTDGRFPVVDQSQAFISGYCDEAARVIRHDLPLVVFGDHTRCFKYVDFPFILGADGTKVLKPNADLFDPKFFYFALRGLDIPNRGYNRHFTVLKERSLPRPPLAEQQKIASVLRLVQRAMEQQERLIALTTELKKALLHQLFTQGLPAKGSATEGLRNEPQKQTEIGPVPQSWEVATLGDVAKLQSGGTPARNKPEYWIAGDIPWVKTGEIDYYVIQTTEERITSQGLTNSAAKVFPKGTLLMAMYGQGVTRGRVGLLGIDAATNQACAAITPHDERRVSTRFIYHFLEFHYEDLRQMGHGANQRNLNAALIKGFRVSFPNSDEQARIVDTLGVLDTKLTLHQSKHAAFTALFRTLLHQLMTAQLRVHALNLPELETRAGGFSNPPRKASGQECPLPVEGKP